MNRRGEGLLTSSSPLGATPCRAKLAHTERNTGEMLKEVDRVEPEGALLRGNSCNHGKFNRTSGPRGQVTPS